MTIECSICAANLLDLQSCAIACGHVYHKTCLANWRQKGSGCPQCRKAIVQTIDLYFPEDNEQRTIDIIMKSIVQLNSAVDAKDKEMKNNIDLLIATIQSLSASLSDLKKDNAEIKEKLTDIELNGGSIVGSGSGGSSSEQSKAKILIENLRKENQDLKIQRAEAAKQLTEIHQQVATLKSTRPPLKPVSGNEQQPKALTLSLKFDDINDQLIVSDLN